MARRGIACPVFALRLFASHRSHSGKLAKLMIVNAMVEEAAANPGKYQGASVLGKICSGQMPSQIFEAHANYLRADDACN